MLIIPVIVNPSEAKSKQDCVPIAKDVAQTVKLAALQNDPREV